MDDLIVELLYQMGKSLGYEFDRVHIKRAAYFPKGHGEIEDENKIIRKAFVQILTGKSAFPMNVVGFPEMEDTESQKEMQKALVQLLGQLPAPVKELPSGANSVEQGVKSN
jgi:uncharacterized protein DUF6680